MRTGNLIEQQIEQLDQETASLLREVPATAAGGPNFSLNLSAQSVTVTAGGSGTLTIGSAAVGGFNGQITLSCAPAAGLTCNFSPTTISPGSNTPSATLTVTAAASAPGGGYGGHLGMLLFSSLGLLGVLFTARGRRIASNGKSLVTIAMLALVVAGTSFTVACGNYSKHSTNNNQATLTITGTSGGISHSVPVAVTIQ